MILVHLLYIFWISWVHYHSVFLETINQRLYTILYIYIYSIIDVQSKFNIIIAIIYFFIKFLLNYFCISKTMNL